MPDWQDVEDDDSPFAIDGPKVDALVYAPTDLSPELSYRPPAPVASTVHIPPAPRMPLSPGTGTPWTPKQVDPNAYRQPTKRPHPMRVFLLAMMPLSLIFGVIYFILRLYGW